MPRSTRTSKPKAKPLFKNRQWQQCYDDWLRSSYELSGSNKTQLSYRSMTRAFFRNPQKTPDAYTRAEVEQFVRGPAAPFGQPDAIHPAKPTTQNARLTALRSFYVFASQYDIPYRGGMRPLLHTSDPTRGVKSVKIGRRRRDLTEEELKKLFAAIPRDTVRGKRDYAVFMFYFWTARRREEIARLTWGDIFEVIFMEHGQPRQGHMYRFTPKGHAREIFTAELPMPAYAALKEYLLASGRWEYMRPDQPLFTNIYHEHQGLSGAAIWWSFSQYVKKAGLKDISIHRQICIHSLRHTRARIQYRREHDPVKIQKLLGHANLATTQIYLVDAEDEPDSGAALLASEFGNL